MTRGLLGLGRMGGNMARRLRQAEIPVTAWNRDGGVTDELAAETGLKAAASVEALVAAARPERHGRLEAT